jgi:hypothetical protein
MAADVEQLAEACATSRKVTGSIPDDIIIFFNYLTLRSSLGPGVYSASNRNEYQKQKLHPDCSEFHLVNYTIGTSHYFPVGREA